MPCYLRTVAYVPKAIAKIPHGPPGTISPYHWKEVFLQTKQKKMGYWTCAEYVDVLSRKLRFLGAPKKGKATGIQRFAPFNAIYIPLFFNAFQISNPRILRALSKVHANFPIVLNSQSLCMVRQFIGTTTAVGVLGRRCCRAPPVWTDLCSTGTSAKERGPRGIVASREVVVCDL